MDEKKEETNEPEIGSNDAVDATQGDQVPEKIAREATFGFSPDGYFFLKIHSRSGFLGILGFLDRAKYWIHKRMDFVEMEKAKNRVVKPDGKFLGRFNLFK